MATTGKYDPKKDEVLAEWNAKDDEAGQGIVMELCSYDGGEPKVKVTRWFKGRDNKWKPDLTHLIPRLRWKDVRWFALGAATMEKAMSDWEDKHASRSRRGGSGGSGSGGAREESPFG